MQKHNIKPESITKPLQLLAAWIICLILIDGTFLITAINIKEPYWIPITLVLASIVNVPIFLISYIILQTKFRVEMQGDEYYSKYLEIVNTNERIEPKEKISIERINEQTNGLELNCKLRAGHYTELSWFNENIKEGLIGQNYYDFNDSKEHLNEFPILSIEVHNISLEDYEINIPIINFKNPQKYIVANLDEGIKALGFLGLGKDKLKSGATLKYNLFGRIMKGVVLAFINNNVESITVESHDGFIYNLSIEQIEEVKKYFQYYFSDLEWYDRLCLLDDRKDSRQETGT